MLAMARRASVDSSCYSTFLAEEFRAPRRLDPQPVEAPQSAFVDALERVICGQPPASTDALDSDGEPRPNLDELAALVVQALDTRNIEVKVAGNTALFVLEMPLASWETVKSLFIAMGGTGPIRATLGPELAKGSDTLVAGLQLLGVVDVDVDAPVDTAEMRLDAVCAPNSGQGPWHPEITVTRTAAGSTLKEIYVNAGAHVVGRGFAGQHVMVHYTDDEGQPLKSLPLEQAKVEPPAKQELFLALSKSLRGRVLDLSAWTGERAAEVLRLKDDEWAEWQAISGAIFDLVLVSAELNTTQPLFNGIAQLCTQDIDEDGDKAGPAALAAADAIEDAHLTAYERADRVALEGFIEATLQVAEKYADFDAQSYFDNLLGRIDMNTGGTVLDLSDCPQEVADVMRELTPAAWGWVMKHPDAAKLKSMLMSEPLYRGGILPVGLLQWQAQAS